MTESTTSKTPAGSTWVPVPFPPELVEIVLKNRERIEAFAMAGLFDCPDGKATVHFRKGIVQGVELEQWTYRRSEQVPLSTGTSIAPKHIPT